VVHFFACLPVQKFRSITKQDLGLQVNVYFTFMRMFPGTEAN